jgi:hypothetical protein
MQERQHATWGELLREAVEKPGRMLEAYTLCLPRTLSVSIRILVAR